MASIGQRNYFRKRIDFSSFETEAAACLSPDELAWVKGKKNAATQLLARQAQHLTTLKRQGLITGISSSIAYATQPPG